MPPVLQLARLRHKHPLQTKKALWLKKEGIDLLKDLLGYLKGSDAILLRICRQFRLRATIQLLFGNADDEQENVQVFCAEVVDMSDITMHHQLWYYIRERGRHRGALGDGRSEGKFHQQPLHSVWERGQSRAHLHAFVSHRRRWQGWRAGNGDRIVE
ncbi:hypothetical protein BKA93DRAFT_789549 [Sparassis latifolia]